MLYVIAYDFGTTGVKSCLLKIDTSVELLAGEYAEYQLHLLPNGGAEQDCNEWWEQTCNTTHRLLEKTHIQPKDIAGISFCSQMQGLVLVDEHGKALRPGMSYMDQRATQEMKRQAHGITVSGVNIRKLLKSFDKILKVLI